MPPARRGRRAAAPSSRSLRWPPPRCRTGVPPSGSSRHISAPLWSSSRRRRRPPRSHQEVPSHGRGCHRPESQSHVRFLDVRPPPDPTISGRWAQMGPVVLGSRERGPRRRCGAPTMSPLSGCSRSVAPTGIRARSSASGLHMRHRHCTTRVACDPGRQDSLKTSGAASRSSSTLAARRGLVYGG